MLVHIQIFYIPIYVVILHILVYANISVYTSICRKSEYSQIPVSRQSDKKKFILIEVKN